MSICVIIPTTNSRQPFHEHIYKCFHEQTYQNKSLIVFEDGIDSVKSQFWQNLDNQNENIKYIHSTKQYTIGEKRNLMCVLSKSDYIAHFDDDDIYLPNYLSFMMENIKDNYLCKLKSWTNFIYDSKRFVNNVFKRFSHLEQNARQIYKNMYHFDKDSYYYRKLDNPLEYGFSYFYKREVINEIRFEKQNFNEDTPWAEKIAKKYPVIAIDDNDLNVIHIQHKNNTSNCIDITDTNITIPNKIKKKIDKIRIIYYNKYIKI
jgi:hypothetical protein